MNQIRRRTKEFLLILASVGVTLSLLDAFLHVTRFIYILPIRVPYPQYYYEKDDNIGFDISKNFKKQKVSYFDFSYDVWSNELGCFDDPYRGETPYIYLAGDSFTWGFTPFQDKWGTKLQSFLGLRTVKCGVPGFGTKHSLLKSTELLEHLPTPELIIVGYYVNDVSEDEHFPYRTLYNGYVVTDFSHENLSISQVEEYYQNLSKYGMVRKPPLPFVQGLKWWLTKNSIIYNLLKTKIKEILPAHMLDILERKGFILSEESTLTSSGTPEQLVPVNETHIEAIRSFKTLAQNKGAKLLFVIIPYLEEVYSKSEEISSYSDKIKPLLEEESIAYLDLLPFFRSYANTASLYWTHDDHWNIQGNHLAGMIVAEYLINEKLIEIPEAENILKVIHTRKEAEFGTSSMRF